MTKTVKVIGNIDFNKVGKYEIEYEVPTLIGKYIKKQIVEIEDTIGPIITLTGGESYNQSYNTEYIEPGYTATDNYDEDLTNEVQIDKEEISENEYNIVYTVQDSSGNKVTAVRKVYIVDNIAPVIKLNGKANMQILLNSKYEEKGATASDEKDGDLTSKIEIIGNVDSSKVGTYTITYKVTDNSGNEATKIRKVTVYKKSEPAPHISNVTPNISNVSNKGVIYLTFDDGPTTSITPKILDILKEKNNSNKKEWSSF